MGVCLAALLFSVARGGEAVGQAAASAPPEAPALQTYAQLLEQIERLNTYNRQLERLVASQRKEMATIEEELSRIEDVSQGVSPLMERMVDALAAFVDLDVPFEREERRERIEKLREALDSASLSESERYRRILQAYQIENDYGRSIEAYRSTLERDGRDLTVDFLRVGRIALIYQTLDESEAGVWNQEERRWEVLDNGYRSAIRRGMRIARKQAAPDLIQLPVPASKPLGGDAL